ncbi:MAG: GntR family transcriptional regulator [Sphingobium sp.]
MNGPPFKSAIDAAAARLREKAMTEEEGAFIGNEDNLQTALGVSRATVRQAARILEGEGMLRVRRGINGGYFAARPNAVTIEKSVSAYLETLNVAGEDLLTIASVLWVEVIRKAAQIDTPAKRDIITRYRERLDTLSPDTGHREVLELEEALRTEIFELIDSRYIELIFHINMAFADRRFAKPDQPEDVGETAAFVAAWRNARRMELNAMADGDGELAALAARHMRNIWQQQMRKRIA